MRIAAAVLVLGLALPRVAAAQDGERIGHVDLFGTRGASVQAIVAALHPIENAPAPSSEAGQSALLERLSGIVKAQTGHAPTDISLVCCDERGLWTVYIGLDAAGSAQARFAPEPRGSNVLPAEVEQAHAAVMKMLEGAVRAGASEDHSQGYALSSDPALKQAQLALRERVGAAEPALSRVLSGAAEASQRAAAAYALGYAPVSKRQIASLIAASRDADGETRNNAVRSLWVIANSTQPLAREIPFDPFISLLTSGRWSDRNKGLLVVSALSERRRRGLLDRLRRDAQFELIEMARWRVRGHSDPARLLLGRLAGIPEPRLAAMIQAGEVEAIIAAAEGKRPAAAR
jgi:hypothetical protein